MFSLFDSALPSLQRHRRPSGRVTLMAVLLCVLPGPLQINTTSAHAATPEYKLKAALLYKLTKFVEWPTGDNGIAFHLCVLGEDVFGDALTPLAQRKVKQQPIKISNFERSDAIEDHCHLLFVTDSKRPFLDSILAGIKRPGTLTISDIKDFATQGGMIEFTRGERKVGFKINLKAAKDAGLSVAAPLLELSTVINRPDSEANDG